MNALAAPLITIQGPTTQARMCKLNLEMSSFLNDPFHDYENGLLNNVIIPRNIREIHEVLGERHEGQED